MRLAQTMTVTQEKKLITDFIDLLRTKAEADHFCTQVEALSESLYSKKTKIKEKIEGIFNADMNNLLLKKFKNSDIAITNAIAVQKFLTELKDEIKKVPIIHITLSFDPKQSTVERIYTWISFNLKKSIFIDIKLDHQIVGGAIIEFEGKYFDYTLKKIITDKMKTYS